MKGDEVALRLINYFFSFFHLYYTNLPIFICKTLVHDDVYRGVLFVMNERIKL